MKVFCLVLVFILLLPGIANAQWSVVVTPFYTITDIQCVDPDWCTIAGGNLVASSADIGDTWVSSELFDLDLITNVDLFADSLGFLTSSIGFGFYKSIDRGTSWQYFGPPIYYLSVSDMAIVNKDTVYGVGAGYFYSSNNGFESITLNGLTAGLLTSVSFTESVVGYLGHEAEVVKKTTDAGDTWADLENSPIAVNRMHFFSTNHGIVLSGGELYSTNDGGISWASVPKLAAIEPYEIIDFSFLDSMVGYVSVYDEIEGQGSILKTTNGGTNWFVNDIPVEVYEVSKIHCLNEDTCFALASSYTFPYTHLLKTTNGGGLVLGIQDSDTNACTNFSELVNDYATVTTCWDKYIIEIYDISGRRILSLNALDSVVSLSMETLPRGIYFLLVLPENDQIERIKFIKY